MLQMLYKHSPSSFKRHHKKVLPHLTSGSTLKLKTFSCFQFPVHSSKLVATDTETHSGLPLPARGGRKPEDTQEQDQGGGRQRQLRLSPSHPIPRPPALTALRFHPHPPAPSSRSPVPRPGYDATPGARIPLTARRCRAGTHPPCPSPRAANQPARPPGGN